MDMGTNFIEFNDFALLKDNLCLIAFRTNMAIPHGYIRSGQI